MAAPTSHPVPASDGPGPAPRMPHEEAALERSLLTGIVAFEWAAIAWASVALTIDLVNQPPAGTDDPNQLTLAHPVAGATLVAAAVAMTAWSTLGVRGGGRWAHRLLEPPALVVHGLLAVAFVLLDVWVYGPGNVHSQSLGSIWPFTWVFVVGVAFAGRGGFAAGLSVGLASAAGELRFGLNRWSGDDKVGAIGTVVLYALGGAVVGFAAIKLREAEREVAFARARDEVARTLHDGVLQTLAVVQRRSPDDELVLLARQQEVELRDFLFGTAADRAARLDRAARSQAADLVGELRAAAALALSRHGLRTDVVAVVEPDRTNPDVVAALKGAVAEALTNAAKHGRATRATVFVDEDDDGRVFVSVKDDGTGFDAASAAEGEGITRSIRGRLTDVGGTVEIDAAPGRGTEVRLRA